MFIKTEGLEPMLAPFEEGGGESGAEETEAAEPFDEDYDDETEGEEDSEVAEPSSGRTDADARFAEMRRENEELRALNEELESALGNFFDGDTEQKLVSANALAQGKSEQEIRDEIEAEQEWDSLNQENEELKGKLLDIETRTQMEHDLQTLQKIDPSIQSLDDMGKDFLSYIASGLSATQAYYATKAKENAESVRPPREVGKVNQSVPPKDFYSREEVKAMSQKEVHEHYDAIRKSMSQW